MLNCKEGNVIGYPQEKFYTDEKLYTLIKNEILSAKGFGQGRPNKY